jgi:hypothetical protein
MFIRDDHVETRRVVVPTRWHSQEDDDVNSSLMSVNYKGKGEDVSTGGIGPHLDTTAICPLSMGSTSAWRFPTAPSRSECDST